MRQTLLTLATLTLLTAACNRSDNPIPTTITDYQSTREEQIAPVRIYTSAGLLTDPAAITGYLAVHSPHFTAATDSTGTGTRTLRNPGNGSIGLDGSLYTANYNGPDVTLQMADTLRVIITIPNVTNMAVRTKADSLFYRMANSVVNLYGSSYRSFPTPSGRDSIYERHLLTVKGQYQQDTFYFPETRMLFNGTLNGIPYYRDPVYLNPLFATPVSLPILQPGDTLAVQQGLRKFHKV